MSIGLTTAELAQIRSDIADLLPDTGHILSLTQVSDGQGGFTDTWGTATANVACRVDAQSGKEALESAAIQPFHRYMLTVPYDTTITTANRFYHSTTTYNIISVNDDQSWKGDKRAVLEKL